MTATLYAPPRDRDDTVAAPPGRFARLWRGDPADPSWARPSMFGLLAATAVFYLYNLTASGTGNTFYAAAVQAGTKSWKAFFFGSFDSASYITVDKPPASLWVMELSGRIFGFSSASMLAPEAIEGVLAVALLYGMTRRISGPIAALVAGATLALTPAAALMFDFNNPDAFLVLLLTAGAYAVVRALESGRTAWLLLAGSAVGFAFLTKMGQAFLVVPAFGLAYLIAGPPRILVRIGQLLAAGVALVVSAGWWVAIVELLPAADRPYVGGSTDNNILNLAFGYNGFGRLFGGSGNGGGGGGGAGGGNSNFGGAVGLQRLFSDEMAVQISWLLPTALIALVGGLWLTRRAPRTDLARAALILWGAWLIVTGLTFSYMEGTIHPYYTVALAPAIAGLVATTSWLVWQQRESVVARVIGSAMILVAGGWTYHLLGLTSWLPVLKYLAVVFAVFGALVILLQKQWSRSTIVAGAAMVAVMLSGSGAYAVATTTQAHTGSTPTVGSTTLATTGGGAGGFGGGAGGGTPPTGGFGGGTAPTGGAGGTPPTGAGTGTGSTGTAEGGAAASGAAAGGAAAGGFAGGGAGGGDTTASTALTALLKASTTKWAAAASSSMSAAPLELASGKAVMAIGGFSGSDNAITLAQFEALVAKGEIHYFIGSGTTGGGGAGGGSVYSSISTWVAAHYTATTVGGSTVYDLTAAAK